MMKLKASKKFPVLGLLALLNFQSAQSQLPSDWPPKGDLDCKYKNKYSEKERMGFYPFSITDTIKLVSFRYHREKIPVGKTIITDSLVEVKTLDEKETHALTDLLYNHFYKENPNYGIIDQCFIPRHAILFYDSTDTLKEYIILCFHCDRYEFSSENIRWGDDCVQKMGKLRTFFISMGVKFGTDLSVLRFEGE